MVGNSYKYSKRVENHKNPPHPPPDPTPQPYPHPLSPISGAGLFCMSFCTSRDVASTGPPNHQDNNSLEHRICTSHPLHAKYRTYALDNRIICLLEGPRTWLRGKCRITYFHALKHNSKSIPALRSILRFRFLRCRRCADIRIHVRRWAKTETLNPVLVRSGCTAKIHLELRFKA